MGFVSSWHCAGMCGPLLLAMPTFSKSNSEQMLDMLIYHAGRISLYAIGGLVVGFVGQNIHIATSQQQISLILGAIVLGYVLFPKKLSVKLAQRTHTEKLFDNIKIYITTLWQRPGKGVRFGLGMLNGLLPCGMVYLALASALTTGAIEKGVVFMIAFGLGTLPMLAIIGFFGKMLHYKARLGMQRAVPFFLAVMACLLMLRGMGLGIPYLSPKMKTDAKQHACCTRPAE